MSIGPRSQCSSCARLVSPFDDDADESKDFAWCAAFPDGIPDKVFFNKVDHRKPVEGDRGLQWVSDGRPFPEESFLD